MALRITSHLKGVAPFNSPVSRLVNWVFEKRKTGNEKRIFENRYEDSKN